MRNGLSWRQARAFMIRSTKEEIVASEKRELLVGISQRVRGLPARTGRMITYFPFIERFDFIELPSRLSCQEGFIAPRGPQRLSLYRGPAPIDEAGVLLVLGGVSGD